MHLSIPMLALKASITGSVAPVNRPPHSFVSAFASAMTAWIGVLLVLYFNWTMGEVGKAVGEAKVRIATTHLAGGSLRRKE